jgi:zinc transport system substrate-binding protein
MIVRKRHSFLVLLAVVSSLLAGCDRQADGPADVAATNTLLASAAADVLGEDAPIELLAGPGMCPGHFDIRPSQVASLRRCRVLLRLDFQKPLDAKLAGATEGGLTIAEISLPGGLGEPASYLAACKQTADALIAQGLLDRSTADARLAEIAARINALAAECKTKLAPLAGQAVLTSGHQAAFCRWAGLAVAGTFSAADATSPAELARAAQAARQADATALIANRPEGRRVADALADRLDAAVIVLDNFPPAAGPEGFDELLRVNTAALVEGLGR